MKGPSNPLNKSVELLRVVVALLLWRGPGIKFDTYSAYFRVNTEEFSHAAVIAISHCVEMQRSAEARVVQLRPSQQDPLQAVHRIVPGRVYEDAVVRRRHNQWIQSADAGQKFCPTTFYAPVLFDLSIKFDA